MKVTSGILGFAFLCLLPTADAAISLGQTDDFESGTIAGWSNGLSAPDPINRSTGGPLGLNDNYLEVNSDGSGPAGRLTVFNRSQWLGNYLSAGVTGISADFKAFSISGGPLNIRLVLKTATFNGAPSYISSTPLTLTVDGSWHNVVFNFSDMSPLANPPALNTVLTNQAEIRFIHSPTGSDSNGVDIAAQVGIDNIKAVPEPCTAILLISGAAGFALRRNRRQSSR